MLHDLLSRSAARTPQAEAIRTRECSIRYGELDRLAERAAAFLASRGVGPGDRVGLWLERSIAAVALMQGALRLGAAYVPIDPASPASHAAAIARNCGLRAIAVEGARAPSLAAEDLAGARVLAAGDRGECAEWPAEISHTTSSDGGPRARDELAYVLYTSGSTGRPKGVCISHENALAFVTWAAGAVDARAEDRFGNHSPFHFDLSVFDLYVAFLVGGCAVLAPRELAFSPRELVELLVRERCTTWYSVPSALVLMMEHGDLLDRRDLRLRTVVFAGEPFSAKHLGRLRAAWPTVRLFNFYGPTETNVCTAFEVHDVREEWGGYPPIGHAVAGDVVWAIKPDGSPAATGEVGELLVQGPTVMIGYWGAPPLAGAPYATGDLVRTLATDGFTFVGRSDERIKIRGHRIEPRQIEAVLLEHHRVREVAVVARGSGHEARLVAFTCCGGERPPTLLELKGLCAARLPSSMIIHETRDLVSLPRTATGKVDRLRLIEIARQC